MLLDERESASGPWAIDGVRNGALRRYEVRRRIMTVGKQRFARCGYENVSLPDVASGAELEWDDFLGYFRDKYSLLMAIMEDGWGDLLPHLQDISAGSRSAHSAILGIFAFMTNSLQQDEDLVRLLLFEGRRPDPEAEAIILTDGYRRFIQLWRDQVVRGQRDGSFGASHHPQIAASMLVGTLEGMLRDRLVAEQERISTPYNGAYLMHAFDVLVTSLKH